jgi:hypothetical protein
LVALHLLADLQPNGPKAKPAKQVLSDFYRATSLNPTLQARGHNEETNPTKSDRKLATPAGMGFI